MKKISIDSVIVPFLAIYGIAAMSQVFLSPADVSGALGKVGVIFGVLGVFMYIIRCNKIIPNFGNTLMVVISSLVAVFSAILCLSASFDIILLMYVVLFPAFFFRIVKNLKQSGDSHQIVHPTPKVPVLPTNLENISQVDKFLDDMLSQKKDTKNTTASSDEQKDGGLQIVHIRY